MSSCSFNVLLRQNKYAGQTLVERNRMRLGQEVGSVFCNSIMSLLALIFVTPNGRMNYGRIISKIESHLTNDLSEFLNGLDQELGNELAHDKYHYTADDGEGRGPQDSLKITHVLTQLVSGLGASVLQS